MRILKKKYIKLNNMKHTFSNIKEGDKLYIIYHDLNDDYQIGEAIVTGFTQSTHNYGDRYEDYEVKSTNINYEFNTIKFSRDLTYYLDKTHFKNNIDNNIKYDHIFSYNFVETFTTYKEAREYLMITLSIKIDAINAQIQYLQKKKEKYHNNLIEYKNKQKINN